MGKAALNRTTQRDLCGLICITNYALDIAHCRALFSDLDLLLAVSTVVRVTSLDSFRFDQSQFHPDCKT
ncbi:hypothetical protein Dimus_018816 [Dionaea muscipula]